MSHVVTGDLDIKDLEALKTACAEVGLEFREHQRTFKWYGKWMNDYNAQDAAVTQGYNPEDFGKCEHAIGVPGKPSAYEIGLVKNREGSGYQLLYDNWQGGHGLEAVAGKGLNKFKQAYVLNAAEKQARKTNGYISSTRQKLDDGSVRLRINLR